MDYAIQIIITLITTTLGSILSYLASTKKSKSEIEAIKIFSQTEINKIKEESEKEIKKIRTETEEQIKLEIAKSDINKKEKEDSFKNELMGDFLKGALKNPQEAGKQLKSLMELGEQFKDFGKK